jgi:hypothetical protein
MIDRDKINDHCDDRQTWNQSNNSLLWKRNLSSIIRIIFLSLV